MIEEVVVREVVKHAEATGWEARAMQYRGRHGCRDYDFYGHGKIVLVEFKRPRAKPRLAQERERRRLAAKGVTVHVVDTIEQGVALLDAESQS